MMKKYKPCKWCGEVDNTEKCRHCAHRVYVREYARTWREDHPNEHKKRVIAQQLRQRKERKTSKPKNIVRRVFDTYTPQQLIKLPVEKFLKEVRKLTK